MTIQVAVQKGDVHIFLADVGTISRQVYLARHHCWCILENIGAKNIGAKNIGSTFARLHVNIARICRRIYIMQYIYYVCFTSTLVAANKSCSWCLKPTFLTNQFELLEGSQIFVASIQN